MNEPYPPEPVRSQSTTSLGRLRNGANGVMSQEPDLQDPKNDFCNAFWGHGDKGYEVLMARLRGAGRTTDELRAFWRERWVPPSPRLPPLLSSLPSHSLRLPCAGAKAKGGWWWSRRENWANGSASIEEDYAKRLSKLSKSALARDEIGDLAGSLQNVLSETSAQAGYHASLAQEIRTSVEGPTNEFATRLSNLKKGLQASVEKSYKNKGLQEGHANKAREKYESDCLKMNGYSANSALTQGREAEKLAGKMDRTRQNIGQNEQDFRQMVQILQGTQGKWENEWKQFCDHVQDLEEDRMALFKDIVWAYANAVSQVCVEDDSSCERIREKLETFEPANDMLAFVKGWGTGDAIPDPPRFINYSAGDYYTAPATRPANFTRLSMRPPLSAISGNNQEYPRQPEAAPPVPVPAPAAVPVEEPPQTNGWITGMQGVSLQDSPVPAATAVAPEPAQPKAPFGGVALPGMTSPPPTTSESLPKRNSSIMPPPPVPPAMNMPEPRVPSRQSQHSATIDDNDPMAQALADLRREPPPPQTVRRNPSHRRPESAISNTPSNRGAPSPAPVPQQRMSYQGGPGSNEGSPDMTLSPPAGGHTAAALAKSMEDFQRQSNRDPKRQSTNYASYANDIVGGHPASRPSSPAPGSRGPSPAMMQPPTQPATHIADEVLSQYHQSFPGERSERARSRAGSVNSRVSVGPEAPPQSPGPGGAQARRQAFAGIGAGGGGGRSPSPQPPRFPSPGPSPQIGTGGGALGPQNMGISLDASGGVAQDSMAEAYRRQYQQQQQQMRGEGGGGGRGSAGGYQQSVPPPQSTYTAGGGGYDQRTGRPTSQYSNNAPPPAAPQSQPPYGGQYGAAPQGQGGYNNSQPPPQNLASRPGPGGYSNATSPPTQYQNNISQSPTTYTSGTFNGPPSQAPQQTHRNSYTGSYQQQQQQAPPPGQPQMQQRNSYARSPSPAPNAYRAPSPAPPPAPQQQYGAPQNAYRAPSPQPPQWQSQQQQAAQRGRSPSPQPGVPPANAAPTGQWSTTGLPVLFYVKALYDYSAQSSAEFDFQQGDIIAVTSTPDDGWWSGELLDEARRLPGRTDFPSNLCASPLFLSDKLADGLAYAYSKRINPYEEW